MLNYSSILFRPLTITDSTLVAELVSQSADYFLLVDGQLPSQEEIDHALQEAGPTGNRHDFWFYGMFNQTGLLIGIIQAAHRYPDRESAHIGQMVLSSQTRGKGLGKQLYQWFEAESRGAGLKRILLSVIKANRNALAFWQRLGFTVTGELPSRKFGLRDYERWEMQRVI